MYVEKPRVLFQCCQWEKDGERGSIVSRRGSSAMGDSPSASDTLLYVLPSTSAAASGYWAVEPWRVMTRELT